MSRSSRLKMVVTGTALATALGWSVGGPAAAAEPRADHPSTARHAPAATPEQQARATGHRVLVPELATETGDTYANPDGTHTLEQRAVPYRVRRGSGWVPIDLTLKRAADGSAAPAAVPTPVTFSGGGSRPMAVFGGAGEDVQLTWPGVLPAPVLSGADATYSNVLPGVDLRLTAQPEGFSEVLIVKDRAAAANPALATLRFGLVAHGVTVRSTPSQALVASDAAGRTVFQSSAPQMWDAGTRRAVGRVAIGPGSLAVTPDRALLTDPATRFPVSIDPDFTAGMNGWAEVYAQHPDETYWGGDGDGVAKVGLSYDYAVTVRSYFQFDVRAMAGKHVISAEFNDLENYAPSCSPRQVDLYESGEFDSSITWNHEPAWVRQLNNWTVAYGYNDKCLPTSLGTDATAVVDDALGSGTGMAAFMWKADNEGDNLAWKKFADNPTLIVTYNSYPNQPGGQSTGYAAHPGEWACADAASQQYVATAAPTLFATATDPDNDGIALDFQWFNAATGAQVGEARTQNQASGTPFSVSLPAGAFADGSHIQWRVRAYDGVDYGAWSPSCYLTVDQTPPTVAPTVTSSDYPKCTPGVVCTSTPVGTTGAFTFTANGYPDVAGFYYGFSDPPRTYVAADKLGGSATVGITPDTDIPQDVYVASANRAGTAGVITGYHFLVGAGTPPVARWPIDGFAQAGTVPDATGGGHDGTLHGLSGKGAQWIAGRVGDAARLDGSTGYISAAGGQVVHTTSSFTASAWVRLDAADGGTHVVLSEDGGSESGFTLGYAGDVKQWAFSLPEGDSATAASDRALSAIPVKAGVWTHLIGTFDAGSGALQLFVNGQLAGIGRHTTGVWDAAGGAEIGRALHAKAAAGYWPGAIDEARLYNRVITAAEAHDLATQAPLQEAFYPLQEGAGTTTSDVSGNFRSGTLTSGVSWVPGVVGQYAAQFDGKTGEIDTAAGIGGQPQTVRTDNSFTATAQVMLSAAGTANQFAVSQDGPSSSAFVLGYRGDTGKWTFGVSTGDSATPTFDGVDSTDGATAGQWTALAGVYDAASRQLRLYVNGVLVGSQPAAATPPANVAGSLVLGRAKLAGTPVAYWGGDLDDVHVYTGVRTAGEVKDEFLNPVTVPADPYPNQLTRWQADSAGHFVTTGTAPVGYHVEGSLGWLVPAGYAPPGAPGATEIYSCWYGGGQFVSIQADCEGQQVIGPIGRLYASAPGGVPSKPVYRCKVTSTGAHFASNQSDCEGQTVEGLLGYALGYDTLVRYAGTVSGHWTTTISVPADYTAEGSFGLVTLAGQPGTTPIYSCLNGTDEFTSTDSGCGGATVVANIGAVWTDTPDATHQYSPVYTCKITATGSHFDSSDAQCEGQTVLGRLGYVMTGW